MSFEDMATLPKVCFAYPHLGGDKAVLYLQKLYHVQP